MNNIPFKKTIAILIIQLFLWSNICYADSSNTISSYSAINHYKTVLQQARRFLALNSPEKFSHTESDVNLPINPRISAMRVAMLSNSAFQEKIAQRKKTSPKSIILFFSIALLSLGAMYFLKSGGDFSQLTQWISDHSINSVSLFNNGDGTALVSSGAEKLQIAKDGITSVAAGSMVLGSVTQKNKPLSVNAKIKGRKAKKFTQSHVILLWSLGLVVSGVLVLITQNMFNDAYKAMQLARKINRFARFDRPDIADHIDWFTYLAPFIISVAAVSMIILISRRVVASESKNHKPVISEPEKSRPLWKQIIGEPAFWFLTTAGFLVINGFLYQSMAGNGKESLLKWFVVGKANDFFAIPLIVAGYLSIVKAYSSKLFDFILKSPISKITAAFGAYVFVIFEITKRFGDREVTNDWGDVFAYVSAALLVVAAFKRFKLAKLQNNTAAKVVSMATVAVGLSLSASSFSEAGLGIFITLVGAIFAIGAFSKTTLQNTNTINTRFPVEELKLERFKALRIAALIAQTIFVFAVFYVTWMGEFKREFADVNKLFMLANVTLISGTVLFGKWMDKKTLSKAKAKANGFRKDFFVWLGVFITTFAPFLAIRYISTPEFDSFKAYDNMTIAFSSAILISMITFALIGSFRKLSKAVLTLSGIVAIPVFALIINGLKTIWHGGDYFAPHLEETYNPSLLEKAAQLMGVSNLTSNFAIVFVAPFVLAAFIASVMLIASKINKHSKRTKDAAGRTSREDSMIIQRYIDRLSENPDLAHRSELIQQMELPSEQKARMIRVLNIFPLNVKLNVFRRVTELYAGLYLFKQKNYNFANTTEQVIGLFESITSKRSANKKLNVFGLENIAKQLRVYRQGNLIGMCTPILWAHNIERRRFGIEELTHMSPIVRPAEREEHEKKKYPAIECDIVTRNRITGRFHFYEAKVIDGRIEDKQRLDTWFFHISTWLKRVAVATSSDRPYILNYKGKAFPANVGNHTLIINKRGMSPEMLAKARESVAAEVKKLRKKYGIAKSDFNVKIIEMEAMDFSGYSDEVAEEALQEHTALYNRIDAQVRGNIGKSKFRNSEFNRNALISAVPVLERGDKSTDESRRQLSSAIKSAQQKMAVNKDYKVLFNAARQSLIKTDELSNERLRSRAESILERVTEGELNDITQISTEAQLKQYINAINHTLNLWTHQLNSLVAREGDGPIKPNTIKASQRLTNELAVLCFAYQRFVKAQADSIKSEDKPQAMVSAGLRTQTGDVVSAKQAALRPLMEELAFGGILLLPQMIAWTATVLGFPEAGNITYILNQAIAVVITLIIFKPVNRLFGSLHKRKYQNINGIIKDTGATTQEDRDALAKKGIEFRWPILAGAVLAILTGASVVIGIIALALAVVNHYDYNFRRAPGDNKLIAQSGYPLQTPVFDLEAFLEQIPDIASSEYFGTNEVKELLKAEIGRLQQRTLTESGVLSRKVLTEMALSFKAAMDSTDFMKEADKIIAEHPSEGLKSMAQIRTEEDRAEALSLLRGLSTQIISGAGEKDEILKEFMYVLKESVYDFIVFCRAYKKASEDLDKAESVSKVHEKQVAVPESALNRLTEAVNKVAPGLAGFLNENFYITITPGLIEAKQQGTFGIFFQLNTKFPNEYNTKISLQMEDYPIDKRFKHRSIDIDVRDFLSFLQVMQGMLVAMGGYIKPIQLGGEKFSPEEMAQQLIEHFPITDEGLAFQAIADEAEKFDKDMPSEVSEDFIRAIDLLAQPDAMARINAFVNRSFFERMIDKEKDRTKDVLRWVEINKPEEFEQIKEVFAALHKVLSARIIMHNLGNVEAAYLYYFAYIKAVPQTADMKEEADELSKGWNRINELFGPIKQESSLEKRNILIDRLMKELPENSRKLEKSLRDFAERLKKLDLQFAEDIGVTVYELTEEAAYLAKKARLILKYNMGETKEMDFNLNELAEHIVTKRKRLREYRSIKLNANLAENLPLVYGNFIQIEEMLGNLMINATHALEGRDDAQIDVITEYDSDKEQVIIKVKDNGIGIPADIQGKVFSPSFTTKAEGKGSGLGLASALEIVKKHGGTIDLHSEEGVGTEFEIRLPVINKEGEPGKPVTQDMNVFGAGALGAGIAALDSTSVSAATVEAASTVEHIGLVDILKGPFDGSLTALDAVVISLMVIAFFTVMFISLNAYLNHIDKKDLSGSVQSPDRRKRLGQIGWAIAGISALSLIKPAKLFSQTLPKALPFRKNILLASSNMKYDDDEETTYQSVGEGVWGDGDRASNNREKIMDAFKNGEGPRRIMPLFSKSGIKWNIAGEPVELKTPEKILEDLFVYIDGAAITQEKELILTLFNYKWGAKKLGGVLDLLDQADKTEYRPSIFKDYNRERLARMFEDAELFKKVEQYAREKGVKVIWDIMNEPELATTRYKGGGTVKWEALDAFMDRFGWLIKQQVPDATITVASVGLGNALTNWADKEYIDIVSANVYKGLSGYDLNFHVSNVNTPNGKALNGKPLMFTEFGLPEDESVRTAEIMEQAQKAGVARIYFWKGKHRGKPMGCDTDACKQINSENLKKASTRYFGDIPTLEEIENKIRAIIKGKSFKQSDNRHIFWNKLPGRLLTLYYSTIAYNLVVGAMPNLWRMYKYKKEMSSQEKGDSKNAEKQAEPQEATYKRIRDNEPKAKYKVAEEVEINDKKDYLRDDDGSIIFSEDNTLPPVTIQLPMFNEANVYQRVIDSACEVEYPRDKLQIQVLDDSIDMDTVEAIESYVKKKQEQGINIVYMRRADRSGFKAGALKAATEGDLNKFVSDSAEKASGDFIAIFDADFIISRDFLVNDIHYFTDDKVGIVQEPWKFINRDASLLTKVQAINLNADMYITQKIHELTGEWVTFHGTAGIWRKKTIEDAGGWDAYTVTEDADLAWRAQRVGYKVAYLAERGQNSELPQDMTPLKSQRYRWDQGHAQIFKKRIAWLWKSELPFKVKFQVTYLIFSRFSLALSGLVSFMFSFPMFIISERFGGNGFFVWFGIATSIVFIFSAVAMYRMARKLYDIEEWKNEKWYKKVYIGFAHEILFFGLGVLRSAGILKGLFSKEAIFVRTPKGTEVKKTGFKKYASSSKAWINWAEFGFGLYSVWILVSAAVAHKYLAIGIFAPFAIGFFWVAIASHISKTVKNVKALDEYKDLDDLGGSKGGAIETAPALNAFAMAPLAGMFGVGSAAGEGTGLLQVGFGLSNIDLSDMHTIMLCGAIITTGIILFTVIRLLSKKSKAEREGVYQPKVPNDSLEWMNDYYKTLYELSNFSGSKIFVEAGYSGSPYIFYPVSNDAFYRFPIRRMKKLKGAICTTSGNMHESLAWSMRGNRSNEEQDPVINIDINRVVNEVIVPAKGVLTVLYPKREELITALVGRPVSKGQLEIMKDWSAHKIIDYLYESQKADGKYIDTIVDQISEKLLPFVRNDLVYERENLHSKEGLVKFVVAQYLYTLALGYYDESDNWRFKILADKHKNGFKAWFSTQESVDYTRALYQSGNVLGVTGDIRGRASEKLKTYLARRNQKVSLFFISNIPDHFWGNVYKDAKALKARFAQFELADKSYMLWNSDSEKIDVIFEKVAPVSQKRFTLATALKLVFLPIIVFIFAITSYTKGTDDTEINKAQQIADEFKNRPQTVQVQTVDTANYRTGNAFDLLRSYGLSKDMIFAIYGDTSAVQYLEITDEMMDSLDEDVVISEMTTDGTSYKETGAFHITSAPEEADGSYLFHEIKVALGIKEDIQAPVIVLRKGASAYTVAHELRHGFQEIGHSPAGAVEYVNDINEREATVDELIVYMLANPNKDFNDYSVDRWKHTAAEFQEEVGAGKGTLKDGSVFVWALCNTVWQLIESETTQARITPENVQTIRSNVMEKLKGFTFEARETDTTKAVSTPSFNAFGFLGMFTAGNLLGADEGFNTINAGIFGISPWVFVIMGISLFVILKLGRIAKGQSSWEEEKGKLRDLFGETPKAIQRHSKTKETVGILLASMTISAFVAELVGANIIFIALMTAPLYMWIKRAVRANEQKGLEKQSPGDRNLKEKAKNTAKKQTNTKGTITPREQALDEMSALVAKCIGQTQGEVREQLEKFDDNQLHQMFVRRFNLESPAYQKWFNSQWAELGEVALNKLIKGYVKKSHLDGRGLYYVDPLNTPSDLADELPEEILLLDGEIKSSNPDKKLYAGNETQGKIYVEWTYMPEFKKWLPIAVSKEASFDKRTLFKIVLDNTNKVLAVSGKFSKKTLRNIERRQRRLPGLRSSLKVVSRLTGEGNAKMGQDKTEGMRSRYRNQYDFPNRPDHIFTALVKDGIPVIFRFREYQEGRITDNNIPLRVEVVRGKDGNVEEVIGSAIHFSDVLREHLSNEYKEYWVVNLLVSDVRERSDERSDYATIQLGARFHEVGVQSLRIPIEYSGHFAEVLYHDDVKSAVFISSQNENTEDYRQFLPRIEVRDKNEQVQYVAGSFSAGVTDLTVSKVLEKVDTQDNILVLTNRHKIFGERTSYVEVAGERIFVPSEIVPQRNVPYDVEIVFDPVRASSAHPFDPVELRLGFYSHNDIYNFDTRAFIEAARLQIIRTEKGLLRAQRFDKTKQTPQSLIFANVKNGVVTPESARRAPLLEEALFSVFALQILGGFLSVIGFPELVGISDVFLHTGLFTISSLSFGFAHQRKFIKQDGKIIDAGKASWKTRLALAGLGALFRLPVLIGMLTGDPHLAVAVTLIPLFLHYAYNNFAPDNWARATIGGEQEETEATPIQKTPRARAIEETSLVISTNLGIRKDLIERELNKLSDEILHRLFVRLTNFQSPDYIRWAQEQLDGEMTLNELLLSAATGFVCEHRTDGRGFLFIDDTNIPHFIGQALPEGLLFAAGMARKGSDRWIYQTQNRNSAVEVEWTYIPEYDYWLPVAVMPDKHSDRKVILKSVLTKEGDLIAVKGRMTKEWLQQQEKQAGRGALRVISRVSSTGFIKIAEKSRAGQGKDFKRKRNVHHFFDKPDYLYIGDITDGVCVSCNFVSSDSNRLSVDKQGMRLAVIKDRGGITVKILESMRYVTNMVVDYIMQEHNIFWVTGIQTTGIKENGGKRYSTIEIGSRHKDVGSHMFYIPAAYADCPAEVLYSDGVPVCIKVKAKDGKKRDLTEFLLGMEVRNADGSVERIAGTYQDQATEESVVTLAASIKEDQYIAVTGKRMSKVSVKKGMEIGGREVFLPAEIRAVVGEGPFDCEVVFNKAGEPVKLRIGRYSHNDPFRYASRKFKETASFKLRKVNDKRYSAVMGDSTKIADHNYAGGEVTAEQAKAVVDAAQALHKTGARLPDGQGQVNVEQKIDEFAEAVPDIETQTPEWAPITTEYLKSQIRTVLNKLNKEASQAPDSFYADGFNAFIRGMDKANAVEGAEERAAEANRILTLPGIVSEKLVDIKDAATEEGRIKFRDIMRNRINVIVGMYGVSFFKGVLMMRPDSKEETIKDVEEAAYNFLILMKAYRDVTEGAQPAKGQADSEKDDAIRSLERSIKQVLGLSQKDEAEEMIALAQRGFKDLGHEKRNEINWAIAENVINFLQGDKVIDEPEFGDEEKLPMTSIAGANPSSPMDIRIDWHKKPDGSLQLVDVKIDAGGDSIHVADIIARLGENVALVALSGKQDGRINKVWKSKFANKNICADFIAAGDWDIKVNIYHVIDNEGLRHFVGHGRDISKETMQQFLNKLDHTLENSKGAIKYLAVTAGGGILFDNMPWVYKSIVEICHKNNVEAMIDFTIGSKEADIKAVLKDIARKEPADIIVPNDSEVIAILRATGLKSDAAFEDLTDNDTVIEYTRMIVNKFNLKGTLVTRADKGLIWVDRDNAIIKEGIPVDVVDTVGCGDAAKTGFIMTLAKGKSIEEAVEEANIFGAATAATYRRAPDIEMIEKLREQVKANPLQKPVGKQMSRAELEGILSEGFDAGRAHYPESKHILHEMFGPDTPLPNVYTLSREKMEELGLGDKGAVRYMGEDGSNNIVIDEQYLADMQNRTTAEYKPIINIIVHEQMAHWCEVNGVPAIDTPMMLEAKIDLADWEKRKKAHTSEVDRAMRGNAKNEKAHSFNQIIFTARPLVPKGLHMRTCIALTKIRKAIKGLLPDIKITLQNEYGNMSWDMSSLQTAGTSGFLNFKKPVRVMLEGPYTEEVLNAIQAILNKVITDTRFREGLLILDIYSKIDDSEKQERLRSEIVDDIKRLKELAYPVKPQNFNEKESGATHTKASPATTAVTPDKIDPNTVGKAPEDSVEKSREEILSVGNYDGHIYRFLRFFRNYFAEKVQVRLEDVLNGRILNIGLESEETLFGQHKGVQDSNIVDILRPLGVNIVGLDPAIENNPQKGYYQGEVEHIPFADNSFDSVVSIGLFDKAYISAVSTLGYRSFCETAGKEIKRVLVDGGRFFVDPYIAQPQLVEVLEQLGFTVIDLEFCYVCVNHKSVKNISDAPKKMDTTGNGIETALNADVVEMYGENMDAMLANLPVAMGYLRERHQQVLRMYYEEGMADSKIAQQLGGVSKAAIQALRQRALTALNKKMVRLHEYDHSELTETLQDELGVDTVNLLINQNSISTVSDLIALWKKDRGQTLMQISADDRGSIENVLLQRKLIRAENWNDLIINHETELGSGIINALRFNGITTVEQLISAWEKDSGKGLKRIGEASRQKIEVFLAQQGAEYDGDVIGLDDTDIQIKNETVATALESTDDLMEVLIERKGQYMPRSGKPKTGYRLEEYEHILVDKLYKDLIALDKGLDAMIDKTRYAALHDKMVMAIFNIQNTMTVGFVRNSDKVVLAYSYDEELFAQLSEAIEAFQNAVCEWEEAGIDSVADQKTEKTENVPLSSDVINRLNSDFQMLMQDMYSNMNEGGIKAVRVNEHIEFMPYDDKASTEGYEEIYDFINGEALRILLDKHGIIGVSIEGKAEGMHQRMIDLIDFLNQQAPGTLDANEFDELPGIKIKYNEAIQKSI